MYLSKRKEERSVGTGGLRKDGERAKREELLVSGYFDFNVQFWKYKSLSGRTTLSSVRADGLGLPAENIYEMN